MQLWTESHTKTLLPSVLVMIVVAIALRMWLGKKDIRVRKIPLQIVAALIILLEIGKQAVSAYGGYDLYHLPFHFCSLLIIAIPAMAFYRGKYTQQVDAVVSSLCASVFILTMAYPSLIYSAGNIAEFGTVFLSFHTVVFHNLAVFAFILIVALRLYTPARQKEEKYILLCVVIFCVVSAAMAQLLKTNYNNFYSCNIGPLESLRVLVQAKLGYGVTQILYILIVTVLDILFVQIAYLVYRLLFRITGKKKCVSNIN